jgi:hypothetical protein
LLLWWPEAMEAVKMRIRGFLKEVSLSRGKQEYPSLERQPLWAKKTYFPNTWNLFFYKGILHKINSIRPNPNSSYIRPTASTTLRICNLINLFYFISPSYEIKESSAIWNASKLLSFFQMSKTLLFSKSNTSEQVSRFIDKIKKVSFYGALSQFVSQFCKKFWKIPGPVVATWKNMG